MTAVKMQTFGENEVGIDNSDFKSIHIHIQSFVRQNQNSGWNKKTQKKIGHVRIEKV